MNRNGPILGVFGIGGFGLEVFETLQKGRFRSNELDLSAFDSKRVLRILKPNEEVTEKDQISEIDFLSSSFEKYFVIAISDKYIRQRLVQLAITHGAIPISLFDENSRINEESRIDIGAIMSTYSLISPNVEVGKYFHLNIYSYVAHDVKIGNFVTFGPRVSCNGNIIIQDNVYIGAGATLINGQRGKPLIIGEGATLGMGAVVIRDVEPYSIMVGNPARAISKKLLDKDNSK
jgi:sugar O-acyltransferase (sialic acid O-acetyltransferase NeuD family)